MMIRSGASLFLFFAWACGHAMSQYSTPVEYFPNVEEIEKSTYSTWIDNHSADYPNHAFLATRDNPNDGAALFWKIHPGSTALQQATIKEIDMDVDVDIDSDPESWIQIAVAVRASGWVSFGVSEAGGMLGADIAIYEASKPNKITDAHIIEARTTIEDDCHNWEYISATTENGWIIVEMSRLLDTRDSQDLRITDDSPLTRDPTRLIAAWGDQDEIGYHGLKRVNTGVKLFIESPEVEARRMSIMEDELIASSDGYIDVRESNFNIPAKDTTYHYVCKTRSEIEAEMELAPGESLTFVGSAAVLTEETARFVHHFVVTASYEADSCTDALFITGWAPGKDAQVLPSDVGIPAFGEGEIQSFRVQIHYDNPSLIPDQLDSSGIRLYFSKTPRKHAASTLILGDSIMRLAGEPIGQGLTKWEFSCGGSCSTLALQGEPVTVIGESLHMHQTGVRMTNEVIRNNKVVHSSSVEVFEFEQQGSFAVQQDDYQIQPGDGFRTTCYYRDGTEFGQSSQEEMCQAYVLYYPAKRITFGGSSFQWLCAYGIGTTICEEQLEQTALLSELELGRTFGMSSNQCLSGVMGGDDDDDGENRGAGAQEQSEGVGTSLGFSCVAVWLSLLAVSYL